MSARLAAGVVVVLALTLAGGCTAHEGQKVIAYNGKANNWTKAPDDGRYALRGADGHNVTYSVLKGERIGFRRDRDGVAAIAGDNAPVSLEPSSARQAYWKFAKKETK